MVVAAKDTRIIVRADRLATEEGGMIHLASIVAHSNEVKALRAMAGKAKRGEQQPRIHLRGFTLKRNDVVHNLNSYFFPSFHNEGYTVRYQPLRYGLVHAMLISKDKRFLPSVSGEALWQILNRPEYTTPILRPWMRYITKKLIEAKALQYTFGHRCRCGLLTTRTAQLDKIVSAGIKEGSLAFDDQQGKQLIPKSSPENQPPLQLLAK